MFFNAISTARIELLHHQSLIVCLKRQSLPLFNLVAYLALDLCLIHLLDIFIPMATDELINTVNAQRERVIQLEEEILNANQVIIDLQK